MNNGLDTEIHSSTRLVNQIFTAAQLGRQPAIVPREVVGGQIDEPKSGRWRARARSSGRGRRNRSLSG